jgi:hypothetical protein
LHIFELMKCSKQQLIRRASFKAACEKVFRLLISSRA